ncbi:MAG TPA: hypothetical protein VFV95_10020 [Vicinamibacterales bacterium]|nr:hypothetical protein [Vicinamibacterales bacterium]
MIKTVSFVRLVSRSVAVAVTLAIGGLLASSPLTAESPQVDKPAPPGWKVPRTPDGHPDLQGTYGNNSITPLERPKEFANKPVLSDAEFAEMQQAVKDVLDGSDAPFGDELFIAAAQRSKGYRSSDRQVGNYSQVWLSDRVLEKRTSQIIDPPDGRIPALSPQALERNAARAAARKANPSNQLEALGNTTRCITMGMPNLFAGYQSYFDITQAPGYVVIRTEMIHEARVIPTDGRPPLSSSIRQLHGDSRGRWEGDTLVVDTTNFSTKSNFRGSSENLHLIERFTRVSPDIVEYRITADDPTTWVRPWTVLINLRRTDEPLVEYACHEGNYGLFGILSAQRAQGGVR